MKKTYSKPMAELIDFSLSASIASGCTYSEKNLEEAFVYSDWNTCEIIPGSELCYHVPLDSGILFNS